MPRLIERLSRSFIKKALVPGFYPDGDGLYLQVTKRGTKSWLLIYKHRKRRRKMGLGSLRLVDLDAARRKRDDAHRLLLDGIDPLASTPRGAPTPCTPRPFATRRASTSKTTKLPGRTPSTGRNGT
jgi:hypothetical protein